MCAEQSAADILENLTELSIEEIYEKRENDQRIGELARELGVYDEFAESFLAAKLDAVKIKLDSGDLTQEEYDSLTSQLEECDGTGTNGVLKDVGMQFGKGSQSGLGRNRNTNNEGKGLNRK